MRYLELVKALDAAGVRFVVVGGVAVILHGVPRTTYDLDLIVDLAPENVERLVSLMDRLGYRPRAPVDPHGLADPARRDAWVREKGLRAFTFWHERGPEIDVLLDVGADYAVAARDALTLDVEGSPLRIASIDVLIALKSASGREQDRSDIEALRRARELAREEGA